MKNMKKLLCAFLVVATVVCFMPVMAFASSDTGASTTGGTTTGGSTTGGSTTGGSTTGGTTTGGSTTGGSTTGGSTTGGSTTGGSTTGGITTPGTDPTTPGSGYFPVDTQAAARAEANTAIKNAAAAEKYEEAEQAEIQAIVEKAAKDIAAAKTAEEIEAIKAEALKAIEAIDTAEEKAEIKATQAIDNDELIATSKMSTLNGKKAVKLSWTVPEDIELDGFYIYRSTKRYSGFGTKAYFKTTKNTYKNNKDLEVGNTYYYKVKGYKVVNGRKVFTGWSTKAWRTIK